MRQSPEAIEYICHLMEGVEEIPTGDLKTGLGWNWEQFADYLNYIDTPHAIDFGANLPHSCLRAYVLGLENANGEPTPAQIEEMQALVRESMAAGAMGFCCSRSANHRSSGGNAEGGMSGDLAPGYFATDEEMIAMAEAVRDVRGNTGVFQCIDQYNNNTPERPYELEWAIKPEDGTHRGMDWMRAISKLGLTVIHPPTLSLRKVRPRPSLRSDRVGR